MDNTTKMTVDCRLSRDTRQLRNAGTTVPPSNWTAYCHFNNFCDCGRRETRSTDSRRRMTTYRETHIILLIIARLSRRWRY